MLPNAPYTLNEPEKLTTNVVFNSPHSGNEYPEQLLQLSRLSAHALRASEDALVDRLFESAPSHGAPLLAATAPRAWVDLNRAPGEFDPALIEDVPPSGLNQRIAAGLGVVPRIVSEGTAIYDGKITLEDARQRVADVHVPYHACLEGLLTRARGRFGSAVLLDCHSMPSEALRAAPRIRGRVPEIVLGDRFGAAAGRHIIAQTQESFENAGFAVARNAPFAGGYITQRYGRPSRGIHAVQIEIDRSLYLDERRIVVNDNFKEFSERLANVISELVEISDGITAVAAE